MVSIGIDIGGTNIAGGVVSADGRLIHKESVPFPGAEHAADSVPATVGLIRSLMAHEGLCREDVCSVGICVPGGVDYAQGTVISAHNLGYFDFRIIDLIRAELPGFHYEIENDANAAALAEYVSGAFKGYRSGLLVTIGTGIGGGLILDGKLFIGGMRHGFEFGHASLVFGGRPCTCGNNGCIEAYCSATALRREGERASREHPESLLASRLDEGGKLSAKDVIDCAKLGDVTACRVFEDYCDYLGMAISSGINVLDPEVVAIGGGVSGAGDFLLGNVRKYLDRYVFFNRRSFAKLVLASMGNDAGIVGAATLYRQRQREGL